LCGFFGCDMNMDRFGSRKINWSAVSDFTSIRKDVQHHLCLVYGLLAVTLATAALGSIVHILYNVGGLLTLFGAIGLILALTFTPHTPANEMKRLGFLLGVGFLQGCSIGPLVNVALEVDYTLVSTAFLGTVAVFACFTGSALLADRRSLLFLGGFLSSCLSLMLFLSFINIFFWSTGIYTIHLYLGLIVFCGFVMFDTQMIIEKASLGDRDYIKHSLDLFVDFVAIFVRILVILMRNRKSNNKK